MDETKAEIEEKVTQGVTFGVKNIITAIITLAISGVFIKFAWGWVVGDVFPGAVAQGIIAGSLTWFAAFKLAILATMLGGVYHTVMDSFNRK